MKRMGKNFTVNAIINLTSDLILKEILNNQVQYRIYQFGSSVNQVNFKDIDLLIIYKDCEIWNQKEIIDFKRKVQNYLNEKYNVPIDITVLSETEEKELNFLQQIKYITI